MTFKWSENAEKAFMDLMEAHNGRVPYSDVVDSLAFKENKKWAEDLLEKGYNIYDIGDPVGANIKEGYSAFYDIETMTIFGELVK